MNEISAALLEHGTLLVGFNVLLQQLGLPVPSVPTMIVAGALAADGRMDGLVVFGISVAATVVADIVWYMAGKGYGYPVLRFLCRVSLSPDVCVRQTEGIFERWGFYSLVVGKFIPGFSTVAPPIAGALGMRFVAFLAATVASAALWVGAAMGFGVVFRREIDAALGWMARNAALAGAVVVGAVALYIAYKAWQRWRLARFVQAALITVDELATRMADANPPGLVDVGSKLAQAHRPVIPGAVRLDLDEIARNGVPFEVDREIVVYCACPNEASAKRAAQILVARGFASVRPLIGGIDGWLAAGHAAEHPSVVVAPPSRKESRKSATPVA